MPLFLFSPRKWEYGNNRFSLYKNDKLLGKSHIVKLNIVMLYTAINQNETTRNTGHTITVQIMVIQSF